MTAASTSRTTCHLRSHRRMRIRVNGKLAPDEIINLAETEEVLQRHGYNKRLG